MRHVALRRVLPIFQIVAFCGLWILPEASYFANFHAGSSIAASAWSGPVKYENPAASILWILNAPILFLLLPYTLFIPLKYWWTADLLLLAGASVQWYLIGLWLETKLDIHSNQPISLNLR